MPELHAEQIRDVFCGVIENLAFMFGDPAQKDDLPQFADDCAVALIGFNGPSSGELRLVAPADIAVELAMNVLGLDSVDDASDETAIDALGELMNVTMGQLITAIAGTEPVFNLTPPQVELRGGADKWTAMLNDDQSVAFMIEDYPVLLKLTIQ